MAENSNINGCITVGPFGGSGGNFFSCPSKGGVIKISVRHGAAIVSLVFCIVDEHGSKQYSDQFGGKGGDNVSKIDIDWPTEYLTSISGSYDKWLPSGQPIIRSLCFHTNLTKYGPFGSYSGTSFSFPIEGGSIVGFHGRAGKYLDAIGVYVKPLSSIPTFVAWEEYPKLENELNDALCVTLGPGPWGGRGGKTWDDGVFSGIKMVHVYVGAAIAKAVQFLYEKKDGTSVWSQRHGGEVDGIYQLHKIKMDCPEEYLVRISGYYGKIDDSLNVFEVLRSITFFSNIGKYGPFGVETGLFFSSPVGGKIVGFHGRSSIYLDAIGIHSEYV